MVGRQIADTANTLHQRCSLEILVSRHLEDMKNGLGLEIKVLVLSLILTKKSGYFKDLDER